MELVEGVNFLQYVRGERAIVPASPRRARRRPVLDAPRSPERHGLSPRRASGPHPGGFAPGRRRNRGPSPCGSDPPRHQALQRPRHSRGTAGTSRFRTGHRSEPDRLQAEPVDRRNPGLHVAGAGIGPRRVRGDRLVQPRRDALRGPDRKVAVLRKLHRDDVGQAQCRAAGAARPGSRHARGSQRDLPGPAPPGTGGAAFGRGDPPAPGRSPVGDLRRLPCDRHDGPLDTVSGTGGAPVACLRSAFEDAGQGRTVVVRLHGPPGAGKTVLARRFLQDVRKSGAVALSGRCYERESVPYKAVDSLVDALSQYLKKLPEDQAREMLPSGRSGARPALPGPAACRGDHGRQAPGTRSSRLAGAPAARLRRASGAARSAWPDGTGSSSSSTICSGATSTAPLS